MIRRENFFFLYLLLEFEVLLKSRGLSMVLMFELLETAIKLISFGKDFSLKLLKVRILLTEKKIQQKEREKSFFRYE
jgi:hypothetical protein